MKGLLLASLLILALAMPAWSAAPVQTAVFGLG